MYKMKSTFNLTYLFIVLIFGNNLYSQDFKKLKKEELINYINNRNSNIDSLNGKLIELRIQRDRLDGELEKMQINLIDSRISYETKIKELEVSLIESRNSYDSKLKELEVSLIESRNSYDSKLKELNFDLNSRLNAISRLEKSNIALTDSLKEISSFVLYSRDFLKPQVGGTYSIGCGEAGGILKIYPVSNDVLLFALQIQNGAPSYNSGEIQGKITLKGNVGHYKEEGCEFKFLFGTYWVIIDEIQDDCPFGAGVSAQGVYTKMNPEIPKTYNSEGEELYFKNLLRDFGL
jgi:hypothetical protein